MLHFQKLEPQNEMLKMMWMAKMELILQFNVILTISTFVMANQGLIKFTMAYKKLRLSYMDIESQQT
jgi:hypothetical protein